MKRVFCFRSSHIVGFQPGQSGALFPDVRICAPHFHADPITIASSGQGLTNPAIQRPKRLEKPQGLDRRNRESALESLDLTGWPAQEREPGRPDRSARSDEGGRIRFTGG
jgi:hypothetical protein